MLRTLESLQKEKPGSIVVKYDPYYFGLIIDVPKFLEDMSKELADSRAIFPIYVVATLESPKFPWLDFDFNIGSLDSNHLLKNHTIEFYDSLVKQFSLYWMCCFNTHLPDGEMLKIEDIKIHTSHKVNNGVTEKVSYHVVLHADLNGKLYGFRNAKEEGGWFKSVMHAIKMLLSPEQNWALTELKQPDQQVYAKSQAFRLLGCIKNSQIPSELKRRFVPLEKEVMNTTTLKKHFPMIWKSNLFIPIIKEADYNNVSTQTSQVSGGEGSNLSTSLISSGQDSSNNSQNLILRRNQSNTRFPNHYSLPQYPRVYINGNNLYYKNLIFSKFTYSKSYL